MILLCAKYLTRLSMYQRACPVGWAEKTHSELKKLLVKLSVNTVKAVHWDYEVAMGDGRFQGTKKEGLEALLGGAASFHIADEESFDYNGLADKKSKVIAGVERIELEAEATSGLGYKCMVLLAF
ncbi:hypothetical protein STEG23_013312 [Scotinomys teguina]